MHRLLHGCGGLPPTLALSLEVDAADGCGFVRGQPIEIDDVDSATPGLLPLVEVEGDTLSSPRGLTRSDPRSTLLNMVSLPRSA